MHASSMENMRLSLARYTAPDYFTAQRRTVVDIGSASVNGSYRDLFHNRDVDYTGLDLSAGPGVDIVLDDPYHYPLADGCADLVLCGQMLEHCEFFWEAFREMVRLLSPDGLLILIAPSAGPVHRYPVDCYRFYPDAYRALAKLAGVHVVNLHLDDRGPWKDLVGIFSRNPQREGSLPRREQFPAPVAYTGEVVPENENTSGKRPYREMLAAIHTALRPRLYLEIGVRDGGSLGLAGCPSIGVDPAPAADLKLSSGMTLCRTTSDDFFEFDAGDVLSVCPDLIFIDGLHHFEQVLRDFMNSESHAHAATVIVLDDIFPNNIVQSDRARRSRMWTGDVWKILPCLTRHRPDLTLIPLDTSPTGMLLITGLNPGNRVLRERYNPLVSAFLGPEYETPSPEILERRGTRDPHDPRIMQLLEGLAALRDRQADLSAVRSFLREPGL